MSNYQEKRSAGIGIIPGIQGGHQIAKIIPIVKQAVNARDLHRFLENKKDFSDWIKHRIQKYGFVNGEDFTTIEGKSKGGRPQIEYALTIEAAKELAMVEGNAKGKQARQYFIACERELHSSTPKLFNPEKDNVEAFISQALVLATGKLEAVKEQNALLTRTIQQQAPKVAYVNQVLNSEECHTITTIAKEIGMGPVKLNSVLHEHRVQYRHAGHWVLYEKYQNKGLTKTRTHTFVDENGETRTSLLTVWTEVGRAFIHSLLGR